jgi:serine/threonine-protein kinase
VGTPLYMAPEQFKASPTDARTDQFSFCVALYQALYGEHPFGGTRVAQLMAAVLSGRVRPAPGKSSVPPWLRRVLLRGLSVDREQRFPSMTELLAALSGEPAGRRHRWIAVAAATLVIAGAAALGSRRSTEQARPCAAGPSQAAIAWDAGRRQAIARAFDATASRGAAQALARSTEIIDHYVARWTAMYGEACEATHVRGEQSAEVLDLRMSCLGERLASVRSLAEVLASADASVVESAVSAAGALPALDRCADVPMLRAVIKPPEDPDVRRRVASLREEVARINALSSAGRCDQALTAGAPVQRAAKQIGYRPLEAEISFALGRLFDTCLDIKEAVADLEDAVMAAEASRDDEIAIEASVELGVAYAERDHDVRAGRPWIRLGESILTRFPGHPLLEARVAASKGNLLLSEGSFESALREEQRALAIQEPVLGPASIDVGMSVNNVAIVLHELGRDREAESSIQRAIGIFAAALGDDSGRIALALANEGEILTSLGQLVPAAAAIDRALWIWRQRDASAFMIGWGLLKRGELELARHEAHAAVATLLQARDMLGKQNSKVTAEAQLALARALVGADATGARARAADLARQAHEALADDPSARRLVLEIEDWQRSQRVR